MPPALTASSSASVNTSISDYEISLCELIIAVLLFCSGGPSPQSVVKGISDRFPRRCDARHTDIGRKTRPLRIKKGLPFAATATGSA